MQPARSDKTLASIAALAVMLAACTDDNKRPSTTTGASDTTLTEVFVDAPEIPLEPFALPDDSGCDDPTVSHDGPVFIDTAPSVTGIRCILGDLVFSEIGTETVDLSHLRAVLGNVEMRFNDGATKLELPALSFVAGDVALVGNPNLGPAIDLPALRTIVGSLMVQQNPALTSIATPALAAVGDEVVLLNNVALVEANLIENALILGGRIAVSNNRVMTHWAGPHHATTLAGPVEIIDNEALQSLEGFDNVNAMARGIEVSGNPSLDTITGFAELGSTQWLLLEENPKLGTVSFGKLSVVRNQLSLNRLASLEDMSGFGPIDTVRWIELIGNRLLTDVTPLHTATGVEFLIVQSNDKLTRLVGIDGPSNATRIDVSYNDALTELDVFASTLNITMQIEISNNDTLANLGGFDRVARTSELRVRDNPALGSLANFAALATANTLRIEGNASLNTLGLTALTQARTNGSAVRINDNPALPRCLAEALVAQMVAAEWTGSADLEGNRDDCTCPNSTTAVCP